MNDELDAWMDYAARVIQDQSASARPIVIAARAWLEHEDSWANQDDFAALREQLLDVLARAVRAAT